MKRFYFEIVLSGIGETVEQARNDAIAGFTLEPGELTFLEEAELDENGDEILIEEDDGFTSQDDVMGKAFGVV